MVHNKDSWEYPKIEDRKLHPKYYFLVYHKSRFNLGHNTDIGQFTFINADYGVDIEDNVKVGSHCSIYSSSTIDDKKGKVILKKNCKIGTHSTIMPNVVVGENSIIGAHSFVNKSIPDNVIAWGVPCKVVKLK